MKTTTVGMMAVLGALALVACGGSDNDEKDATDGANGAARGLGEPGANSSTLVDRCSEKVSCVAGTETTSSQLAKRDGVCYLGALRLEADGTAIANDLTAQWRATTRSLDVCVEGDCMSCTTSSSAPSPSSSSSSSSSSTSTPTTTTSSGFCAGNAEYCHRIDVYECEEQDGCDKYVGTGTGTSDSFCSGDATGCNKFYAADTCKKQRGCVWYEH